MKNTALLITMFALAIINMVVGSVDIPAIDVWHALTGGDVQKESWRYIVLESRLPQTITAMLCGSALAASGLLLQTAFRNPLAGPSILGITNGASLGVAIVMLLTGGILGSLVGVVAITAAAFIGALAVIVLLFAISHFVRSNMMLLIVGLMISYLVSSVVSLLNVMSNADNVHGYVMWGMGSFSNVTLAQLPYFAIISGIGLLIALLLIKSLNALLLGDNYATNLGVNTVVVRRILLLSTGILAAVATAFCGPVAFIGLAVPHIARLFLRSNDHLLLMPATILCGAIIALLCNIICVLPSHFVIPLNAVTPLFGAPVIIYVIFRGKAMR